MIKQGPTGCSFRDISEVTFILLNLAHLNIQEPEQTKRSLLDFRKI